MDHGISALFQHGGDLRYHNCASHTVPEVTTLVLQLSVKIRFSYSILTFLVKTSVPYILSTTRIPNKSKPVRITRDVTSHSKRRLCIIVSLSARNT